MGLSKEKFMEHREAEMEYEKWCEAEYRNKCSDNWIDPITYPWSGEKEEPVREIREKPDNPKKCQYCKEGVITLNKNNKFHC